MLATPNSRNETDRQQLWGERLAALKNLPGVMRLIWDAAPRVVAGALLFRLIVALVPLGILTVSRRIIDLINFRVTGAAHDQSRLWPLLWAEFGLAAGGLIVARAIDYCDSRL